MKLRDCLAGILVMLGPTVGEAAPLSVAFTGTVFSSSHPDVEIGAAVTGSFVIDPSVPDFDPSPHASGRAGAIVFGRLEVRSAGFAIAGAPLSSVLYVDDDSPPIGTVSSRDTVAWAWEYGSSATGLDVISLALTDPTTTALSSDALPFSSLDLAAFASRGRTYSRFENFQAAGAFSFTRDSMTVPEPPASAWLAIGGAMAGMACVRRRPQA